MGRKTPDLAGQRFGRLRVLSRDHEAPGPHAKWLCWCAPELGGCGTMTSAGSGALRSGMTQSCGCLHGERTASSNAARAGRDIPQNRKPSPPRVPGDGSIPVHRNRKPRARTSDPAAWRSSSLSYGSWINMTYRCTRPDHPQYADYGGRGITIDPDWMTFDSFLADMGERPPGMTLERKDNHGPYCRENCVWATPHQQNMNTRAVKLIPAVIAEIKMLREAGLSMNAIGAATGLNRKTVSIALSGKTRQRGKAR